MSSRMYRGNSTSYSNIIARVDDGKVYRGNSTSYSNIIATTDGGDASGAAAAAFLLLM